mmetsp:Transcript_113174/g.359710  ORF Transcript_113174/g.359710 Transcript_113174/m.359710 type:complete len:81 (+) Transcript_113174:1261-1503(+)
MRRWTSVVFPQPGGLDTKRCCTLTGFGAAFEAEAGACAAAADVPASPGDFGSAGGGEGEGCGENQWAKCAGSSVKLAVEA